MEQNSTNILTIESFVEESEGMKKCVNEMYNSVMKSAIKMDKGYKISSWKTDEHLEDIPSCQKYLENSSHPEGLFVMMTALQQKLQNNQDLKFFEYTISKN